MNIRIIIKQRSNARTRLDFVILLHCNQVMRQEERPCLRNILELTVRHDAKTLHLIQLKQVFKLHVTEDGIIGTGQI